MQATSSTPQPAAALPLLTYAEAASLLEISNEALWQLVHREQLSRATVGKEVYVIADDLLARRLGTNGSVRLAEWLSRREARATQAARLHTEARLIDEAGTQITTTELPKWLKRWVAEAGLDGKKADDLILQARCCLWSVRITGKRAAKDRGFATSTEALEMAAKWMQEQHLYNWQVSSARGLRDKATAFEALAFEALPIREEEAWETAFASLLHKGQGNKNRAYPDRHYAILAHLYADWLRADGTRAAGQGAKNTAIEIHRRYEASLEVWRQELIQAGLEVDERDFTPMHPGSVGRYLASDQARAYLSSSREGKAYVTNHYQPHAHRGKPVAWSAMTGDGVNIPMLTTGGQVTVWFWRDWATGATLGYSCTQQGESPDLVRQGLKDVWNRWGRMSHTVQVDDVMRHREGMAQMLNQLNLNVMPKEPYNPQESMAETLNRQFLRHIKAIADNWVTINNKTDAGNRKIHDMPGKGKYKSYEETLLLIDQAVAMMNADTDSTGRTRLQRLAAATTDWQPEPEMNKFYRLYFGQTRRVGIRRGYIELTPVPGEDQRTYLVKDYHDLFTASRDKDGLTVFAAWDPKSPGEIEVYQAIRKTSNNTVTWEVGGFIQTAQEAKAWNPVPADRTADDEAAMVEQQKERMKFKAAANAHVARQQQILEENDLDMERIADKAVKKLRAEKLKAGAMPSAEVEYHTDETEESAQTPPKRYRNIEFGS